MASEYSLLEHQSVPAGVVIMMIARDIAAVIKANQVDIRVNLNPLEEKTMFSYLRRKFTFNNSDWGEVYINLVKAQRR